MTFSCQEISYLKLCINPGFSEVETQFPQRFRF